MNDTIWNQHRVSRRYDGHAFHYLKYMDFMEIVSSVGLTDADFAEFARIQNHQALGDNSPEFQKDLEWLFTTQAKVPHDRLYACCISDLEESAALKYIYDTPRTELERTRLMTALDTYADLVPAKYDPAMLERMINMMMSGIQWIQADTITLQQARMLFPALEIKAKERMEAQEKMLNGGNNIGSRR